MLLLAEWVEWAEWVVWISNPNIHLFSKKGGSTTPPFFILTLFTKNQSFLIDFCGGGKIKLEIYH
jgi:hypothetical protein